MIQVPIDLNDRVRLPPCKGQAVVMNLHRLKNISPMCRSTTKFAIIVNYHTLPIKVNQYYM